VQDRAAGIQLIASFLGIALTPELQTTALEQSSLEFMARHRSKYDEHHLKQRRNAACGLDKSAGLQGNEVCKTSGVKLQCCRQAGTSSPLRRKTFSHQFQKHAEWKSPSSLGVATLRTIDVSIQGKVRTSPKAKSSASSLQLLQQKWMQVMQPVCGHKSYSDMRKAINAELSR
jgi:hypothetical protein